MRRRSLLAVLVVSTPTVGGGLACYHPQTLDARSVLDEVAREQPPARAQTPAPRASLPRIDPQAAPRPAGPPPGTPAGTVSADGRGGAGADAGPAGATLALTEDQAVARALLWNPDLRAQRHQLGIAEGEITAATALANPTVELELLHLEALAGHSFGLRLAWEPPQPGVYAAKRAATEAQADAVKSEIAEAEWQLVTAVRGAHANLLAITEQQGLVGQSLEKRRRISALVDKRMRGGASTSIDLSLADLSVAEVEREREALMEQELDASRQLGQLLGSTRSVRAAGAIPEETAPLPGYDGLVEAASSARPALAAERDRFRQREETIRLENARRWPWFKLTGAPRYRYDSTDTHPTDYSVGVQVTVPILDQNAGPIRIAEATRDAERERYRAQAESIRREVAAALDEVAQRRVSLQRYRAAVLPSLDAHERLLGIAAQGGQIDVVAVLRAEDAILRSRSEFVAIRRAHHQAWLRLDLAVGRRVAAETAPVVSPQRSSAPKGP